MKKLQALIIAVIVGLGVTTIANAARNAYGVYSLPLPDPAPGSFITRSWANTTLHDIGNELTNSLDNRGGAMSGSLKLPNGAAGSPAITFSQDTTVGLYRPASGQVAVTVSGATPQTWTGSGTSVSGTLGVSGTSTLGTTTTGALTASGLTVSGGSALGPTSTTTLTATGVTALPAATSIGGAAPITTSNIGVQTVATAANATNAAHVYSVDGASGGTLSSALTVNGAVTANSVTIPSPYNLFVTYATWNTAISEPTCGAGTHGLMIVMRAANEATKPCLCTLKSDNSTYAWRNIVNGGWGSSTTCPPYN